LQVLCSCTAVLLAISGGSMLLISPSKQALASRTWSARLVSLHKKGDLKKKLLAANVLGAATTLAPIPADCKQTSCIALTFDDGPNPLVTPQIVSILESEHVPATFFMVGSRVAGNEALLQRMHSDGDEIGNHSWSHPDFTKLTPDQIKQQVALTQNAITAAGVPAPTLFRPPYGAINQTVRDNVAPLTFGLWNEDPKDWAANTWQQVLVTSEASAKSGGVVDLHDIYHVTANALQPLIQHLKAKNFQFVTMSQLMQSFPPNGEFYGGYHP